MQGLSVGTLSSQPLLETLTAENNVLVWQESSWRLELSGDKELSGSDGLVEEKEDFLLSLTYHLLYHSFILAE